MYTVATAEYEGPLQKLLELIQKRELAINRISLAAVTAGFLEYVAKLGTGSPSREHAEFLNVASKLILIKSRALLPQLELTAEEEEDITSLEHQLQTLTYVHERGKDVNRAWSAPGALAVREFMFGVRRFFVPPAATPAVLAEQAARFSPPPPAAQAPYRKRAYANLETVMSRLLSRLGEQKLKLSDVHGESREEKVAFFLAVLHLFRKLKISARQTQAFSDIVIAARR